MMGRHRVRTTLLTPTMLRVMRQIPDPVKRYGLDLRTIISGGESVGKELHEWSTGALGVPINEMFGQTECNLVLASNGNMMPVKPGSLGRAVPGHVAGIVDDSGQPLAAGTIGNLAFRSPDPVMMLEYWQNPEATREQICRWLADNRRSGAVRRGWLFLVPRSRRRRHYQRRLSHRTFRNRGRAGSSSRGGDGGGGRRAGSGSHRIDQGLCHSERGNIAEPAPWSRKSAILCASIWPGMKCRATSNSSPRCR